MEESDEPNLKGSRLVSARRKERKCHRDTDLQDESKSSKQLLDQVCTVSTGWQAWPSDLSKRDWLHAMDLRARKSGLRTEWKRKCRPAARYSFAFIMVRVYICIYTGYIARRNRGVSIPRRVGMHHRRQSRRNTTVPIECMQIIKDIVRRLIKQTRYRPYVSRESIFSFFFFFFQPSELAPIRSILLLWRDLNPIESEKESLFYDFIELNFENITRTIL